MLTYFEGGDLASLSRADCNALIAAASATEALPSIKPRSKRLAIPVGARR